MLISKILYGMAAYCNCILDHNILKNVLILKRLYLDRGTDLLLGFLGCLHLFCSIVTLGISTDDWGRNAKSYKG